MGLFRGKDRKISRLLYIIYADGHPKVISYVRYGDCGNDGDGEGEGENIKRSV
jgi:hypothetical protein